MQGFVYVALVTDVFARRIVCWCLSGSMRSDFVPDVFGRHFTIASPSTAMP